MLNTDLLLIVRIVVTGIDCMNPDTAYKSLSNYCTQFSYNLDNIKANFLKVSDLTDTIHKLKELDQQELALVLAHNAYTVGAALTGCMYTNPEDYDPVHTLACITDALACILVLQELKESK